MVAGFLRRLLLSTGHTDLPPEDARLAVASVMVMAARADGKYEEGEEAMIDRVLVARFGMTPAQAKGLREEAEHAEQEAVDLYQFTKAIKTVIPHDDRIALLEELWLVVLADGARDPHEDSLMRQITDRLGLSPMDSALARRKMQDGGAVKGM